MIDILGTRTSNSFRPLSVQSLENRSRTMRNHGRETEHSTDRKCGDTHKQRATR